MHGVTSTEGSRQGSPAMGVNEVRLDRSRERCLCHAQVVVSGDGDGMGASCTASFDPGSTTGATGTSTCPSVATPSTVRTEVFFCARRCRLSLARLALCVLADVTRAMAILSAPGRRQELGRSTPSAASPGVIPTQLVLDEGRLLARAAPSSCYLPCVVDGVAEHQVPRAFPVATAFAVSMARVAVVAMALTLRR